MGDKQHYWVDIESGVRFPCSKEYYDTMKKIWEDVKPKFKRPIEGRQLIIGTTAGENHFLKDMYMSGIDPISEGSGSSMGFIPLKAEWNEED